MQAENRHTFLGVDFVVHRKGHDRRRGWTYRILPNGLYSPELETKADAIAMAKREIGRSL